jgi:NAD(P)H-dependent FMN reductase
MSQYYVQKIKEKTSEEVKLLDLSQLPDDIMHVNMYGASGQSPKLQQIQESYMIPAEKFVFIIPEYNGSFPGVLKLFIDACSVYKMGETFKKGTKKALTTGVSSGRAGNLRGLVHFAGVLNYLNVAVLPNQLPISNIENIVHQDGSISNQETVAAISKQIDDFLRF